MTKRVASGEKERVLWNWNFVVVVGVRASARATETSIEVWKEKNVVVGFMFGQNRKKNRGRWMDRELLLYFQRWTCVMGCRECGDQLNI